MNNKSKDKWYIIYAKTAEVKKEWMDAFQKERKRVQDDCDKGTQILDCSNKIHMTVKFFFKRSNNQHTKQKSGP